MATIWLYRETITGNGFDPAAIVGYDVEALDGHIGKIDESSTDADRSHVVVDTGFWIFGKRRLIPAGAITRVDHDEERVYVSMTKDQIKDAPDYDDTMNDDDNYHSGLGDYYRPYIAI